MRALYTSLVSRSAKDRPANAREVAEALFELVPQGKDAAASEIAKLLDSHFASQAEDQRKRLTTSLRESGLPPEPASVRPVSAKPAPAPREEPKRSSGLSVFVAIGLGLVAISIYAYVQTHREPTPLRPPSSSTSLTPVAPLATTSPPPEVSSSPPPIASAAPVGSVPPPPKASVATKPPVVVPAPKPKPSAVPTTPTASASSKPPDVITNPF
jgi:cytoskeletal protein RodZ